MTARARARAPGLAPSGAAPAALGLTAGSRLEGAQSQGVEGDGPLVLPRFVRAEPGSLEILQRLRVATLPPRRDFGGGPPSYAG